MTDVKKKIELKKCPFCGAKSDEYLTAGILGESFIIRCRNCSATVLADTQEQVVSAWNARKTLDKKVLVPAKEEGVYVEANFDTWKEAVSFAEKVGGIIVADG